MGVWPLSAVHSTQGPVGSGPSSSSNLSPLMQQAQGQEGTDKSEGKWGGLKQRPLASPQTEVQVCDLSRAGCHKTFKAAALAPVPVCYFKRNIE